MVAPLILEHVVEDVEALLGALAEVTHLETAGGEDPAARALTPQRHLYKPEAELGGRHFLRNP